MSSFRDFANQIDAANQVFNHTDAVNVASTLYGAITGTEAEYILLCNALQGDVGAALSLTQKTLPEWTRPAMVQQPDGDWGVSLLCTTEGENEQWCDCHEYYSADLALGIVMAMAHALANKVEAEIAVAPGMR